MSEKYYHVTRFIEGYEYNTIKATSVKEAELIADDRTKTPDKSWVFSEEPGISKSTAVLAEDEPESIHYRRK